MSIIEKIKAEVERLKRENTNIKCEANEKYCLGYEDGLNDLLSTLQEKSEKPINPKEQHFGPPNWYPHPLEEQPVCEDLEEEISRYLREECSDDDEPSISEVARHFYELGMSVKQPTSTPN